MGDINARLYTSIPRSASPEGSQYGSNEEIYLKIKDELKKGANDIEEVHLALYLFNNVDLFNTLRDIAKKARVRVTTIPLAGYDKRKVAGAEQVYKGVLQAKDSNFDLLIYPHVYVWYEAEYAEGGASYSFHVKAGYITYKDGSCKLILTSCNLSPKDPYHSEIAIVIEDPSCSTPYSLAFKKFFNQVEQLAKPWQSYFDNTQGLSGQLLRVFDFAFIGKRGQNDWSGNFVEKAFFTGPFITIKGEGSTWYARRKIVDLIMSAEKRLLVAAQHIHDIAPFNGYVGKTVISAIAERKKDKPSLEVKVLKQVPSRGLADKRRAAFVECHLNYAGVEQKANKLVHDKFIVADDVILITTSNFTATQFGWGEREMKLVVEGSATKVERVVNNALSFFGHPQNLVKVRRVEPRKGVQLKEKARVIKHDIFAEVNGFIIIESKELANALACHFGRLWGHKLSEPIKVLT